MTKRIFITGIVQGVGFRPCCKKVADEMQLSGTVKNLGACAEIVIKCDNRVTEEFLRRLVSLLPNEARIESVNITDCDIQVKDGFEIISSTPSHTIFPEIIPDVATCDICLNELENSLDRRHRHPFISCTACGPRYSIIKALPYDRANTSMDKFRLCNHCRQEYTDNIGRRLHAQTIACNDCGPTLSWVPESKAAPLLSAVLCLKSGGVIAVKDIGGYHFVCMPDDKVAVENLRNLKLREQKPFAVMFENIDSVKEYAEINPKEEELLLSPARPIVLVEKIKDFEGDVCADSRFIGAMLPSNPVQHMLIRSVGPLVMTSGNISGEPIITNDSEILKIYNENKLLRGVLYHDREILTPLDDSIYYVIDDTAHIARRGRGVVPSSITVDCGEKTIFAAGGDLKASFAIYKNKKAVMSQHFGDLENTECVDEYKKAAKHMAKLYDFAPDVCVCDMHPIYFSSGLSHKIFGSEPLTVQHHHAHIASVMAEHSIDRVLGFALDGTGYGTDKTVWGGEALLCDGSDFKRIAHLKAVTLCGGDEISKNAAETLACYLLSAGIPVPKEVLNEADTAILSAAIKMNINCVKSSSCGRLFDAVCCLLGFGDYNHFEGQCAISLENAAAFAIKRKAVAYPLELDYNNGVLDTLGLIRQISDAKNRGVGRYSLALGFHYALADGLVKVAKAEAIKEIALSGGSFNNRILTAYLSRRLKAEGFSVYMNEKVPCGDGGIALGQLYLAGRKD